MADTVSATENHPFGPAKDGLECRIHGHKTRFAAGEAIVIELEFRYVGTAGDDAPAMTPHLLLPRTVDRNHLVEIRATAASGEELAYRGPKPPGDIGDVEDIVLEAGKTIPRSVDISGFFSWQAGHRYRISAKLAGWSYETHYPTYWTGTIGCGPLTIEIAAE